MILVCLYFPSISTAQAVPDTSDKAIVISRTDSLPPDSVALLTSDELKSKVHYTADDSIRFEIANEKVFLYGNARVTYEDIEMTAAYMEVNWLTKILFAKGTTDSVGAPSGLPVFKQNEDQFTAEVVTYNFETKKGKIKEVQTKQGDGYVHGETIKRIDENTYFIWKGAYTTCDLPHPHYSISSNKLKVIQNNKIITGPAYLVIEDVPTPLAIPFGYFPTRKGRAAGILFPSYGESGRLGFFLKDGGYYFGLGDVVDFAVTGDIYSLGSWGLKLNSAYANRYHYGGNVSLSYSEIKESEKELPDYRLNKDFFIRWNHRQDPKARPTSVFSANVNAGSSNFYQNNISSANNYLSNTFQSSVSWSKIWPGKPYNFSSSLSHSQNTITNDISLSLPVTNFSVNRIYPLKRKVTVGSEKWYEKIGVSYQNNFQNSIQTKDSLLFERGTEEQFRYGMSHAIPVSTSFKALKYFTVSPSITYNEKWYMKTIRKNYSAINDSVITDTISGFRATRDFQFSASMNTRLYGMVQMKKGKIAAIRHVLSPTLSYTYRPDFSEPKFNAYKNYQSDSFGTITQYSIYETGIFGGPPSGKYGVISLNLDNNLEMKTRSVTDTAVNLRKIKIFESLSGNVSYNTAIDSLNWSNINISGRTTLFERLNLNFSGSFDPYITDSIGRKINQSEWDENNRLARLVNTSFTVGYALNNQQTTEPKTSTKGSESELERINRRPQDYVDFTIPFNIVINYSFSYSRVGLLEETINQTLNFNGDVSLTPKWKITFNSGYDFSAKDLSYTSLGIYRDLHCWEMRINWVPFGQQENYYFQINVKSSILQDLKLTKKNDIYDF
ncbi:MAG: LPS-assembly protein LptD [Bacteroidota bacterium]|nr:LPS-assembly protein LptD [Bacteroidota bacterium]